MTNKPRFSVTIQPYVLEQVNKYKEEHGIATQSGALEQLISKGIDALINEGTIPDVRKPIPPPPVPEDLTEEVERLIQTITPEQAAFVLSIAKKTLKYAESRRKR